MKTRIGRLEVSYSARGVPTYSIELWHDGLKKHRFIKGAEKAVVSRKAQIQGDDWGKKWTFVEAREKGRIDKNNQRKEQEFNKNLAMQRTEETLGELNRLGNILKETLEVDDAINWNDLKDESEFPEPKPPKPLRPAQPQAQSVSKKPCQAITRINHAWVSWISLFPLERINWSPNVMPVLTQISENGRRKCRLLRKKRLPLKRHIVLP